jgi:hypothetical protein
MTLKRSRRRFQRIGWPLAYLLATAALTAAQAPKTVQPLSADQRRTLLQAALKDERVVAFAKGQRVRALSVSTEEVEKDGEPSVVAVAVVVNYGTGQAVRVRMAPDTGRVESVEPLPGRPQSSAEERQEAEAILKVSAEITPLLSGNAVLRGGFVVDPPAGAPATGRYLEYHIVTADGRSFVAEVVVDLAAKRVAQVRRAEANDKRGGA